MIVCTAGHVDHGKTALVKALTGVDTDRLAEERRRGLTIELGFAPLELPGVGRASVVDVPGHGQFIPTMLSGCSNMDGVLFTVAADEGPMPQTAEHLDILSLLGAERGVVALTRADLADPARLAETAERTRELVKGTFLEGAPMLPVSAVTGAGLDGLRAALARMLAQVPPPPAGAPCLHIDRAFPVAGSGTVVTGTLTGGPLRRGDAVRLYPSERTARVRGLQCHGVPAEELPAGTRAAVNLAGVRLREIRRGDTLAAPGSLTVTDRADVSLEVLPDAPFPVRTDSQLHFHHGARSLTCRCVLLGRDVLRPGEVGWAQLRFAQPLARGEIPPPPEPPPAPPSPAVPAPSDGAEQELAALYRQYGLTAPAWERVEPRFAGRIKEARRALRRLRERGELAELAPGRYVHREAAAAAERALRDAFGAAPFRLAQARDALGLSRGDTLLLLELWDSTGVTRREGDARRFT